MRRLLSLLLAAPLLAWMGCGPHHIPGTDLEDTGDTRAIIDVMQKYNDGDFGGANRRLNQLAAMLAK